nr:MAG TPA: hypothetical protein [Caudoviricetes sp.]
MPFLSSQNSSQNIIFNIPIILKSIVFYHIKFIFSI